MINNTLNINKILVSAVIALSLFATHAIAAQQGHLKLTSKVQKMVITTKNDGSKAYKFLPATKVLPGETLQYNTFYENVGNKPAADVNIVNPIPKHLVYLPNSAQGKNTNIMFSVDGGKHYGKAGTLKVRGTDGKIHPAKPSNYTHIKWQFLGNLAPKAKQAVTFRARLL